MGFFDKLKKTAQNAFKTEEAPPPQKEEEADAEPEEAAPVAVAAAYDGPTFRYDGDDLPMPPGWDGLSVEDWFFKLETLRDRLMHADEEALAPMKDEDGEPLDPEETILILEGFKSGGHYEKFRSWGAATWARKLGTDPTNLEFKMSGIAREKIMAAKAGAMSGAGGALEPVEGVSVETWAQLNAALASGGGGNFDAMLAGAGMDRPKWDRVSAEWMARMATDTTMAIANVYGAAFSGGVQGKFGEHAAHAAKVGVGGDLSSEPMPFERYCEIEAAMGCASDRGEDVNQLLASFGLNAVEWGQLGAFWSKKMQQDAMGYHRLYTQYSEKYKAQYSTRR
jgi:hypothetical protein